MKDSDAVDSFQVEIWVHRVSKNPNNTAALKAWIEDARKAGKVAEIIGQWRSFQSGYYVQKPISHFRLLSDCEYFNRDTSHWDQPWRRTR